MQVIFQFFTFQCSKPLAYHSQTYVIGFFVFPFSLYFFFFYKNASHELFYFLKLPNSIPFKNLKFKKFQKYPKSLTLAFKNLVALYFGSIVDILFSSGSFFAMGKKSKSFVSFYSICYEVCNPCHFSHFKVLFTLFS